jgi:hypothetical protein
MWRLISTSKDAALPTSRVVLPRVLVQFWDDALSIPDDVRACLDSWAPLEIAGFKRLLFDDVSARNFIQGRFSKRHVLAFDRCRHPAMRADYFRLCFILELGGLYVDADDEYVGGDVESLVSGGRLRLQTLCYDIASDSMVDVTHALKDNDTEGRIFYVNNNPLIAASGHPIIARALERSTALLFAMDEGCRDIQYLTGPGNLTASLVAHAAQRDKVYDVRDFELLTNWDSVAISKWPLAYRVDGRNWRN